MMKNIRTITTITILFCGFVFVLTVLDFAALHDIKKDYVSPYILDYLKVDTSKDLPDWTATTGEWQLVSFSLYSRFLFFILNMALLIYLYRKVAAKSVFNNSFKKENKGGI